MDLHLINCVNTHNLKMYFFLVYMRSGLGQPIRWGKQPKHKISDICQIFFLSKIYIWHLIFNGFVLTFSSSSHHLSVKIHLVRKQILADAPPPPSCLSYRKIFNDVTVLSAQGNAHCWNSCLWSSRVRYRLGRWRRSWKNAAGFP